MPNDLISRQAVLSLPRSTTRNFRGEVVEETINVADVMALPSAESEIIRCKDCKHKPSGDATEHDITFPDNKCPCQCEDYWYSWIPSDNWYCGYAERRQE